MPLPVDDPDAPPLAACGFGVGGTCTGRGGPAFDPAPPGFGPGELSLFGPGDGCVPLVVASFAPCVGLGLGTPAFAAGALLGRLTGCGDALGADVVREATTAAAVGTAVGGALGAGVAGFAVGAAVGAGGRGVGFAVGAIEGTGLGAAVGGIRTATDWTATDGIVVGTAGNSFCGFGS
jgi:hypothetical protein